MSVLPTYINNPRLANDSQFMYTSGRTMIKFLAIVILVGVAFADPIAMPSLKNVPTWRIIDGEDSTIEEIPYQVSILHDDRHICGGSIISENWVLTAAHCMESATVQYYVRSGSSSADFNGTIHTISRIINHENYVKEPNTVSPHDDIALIEVSTPFVMGTTRQPIELFKSGEESKAGMFALISGWGSIRSNTRIYPETLQSADVLIISKNDCKKTYSSIYVVHPDQICAGYSSGGEASCKGDSGGPLVIEDRLAGIVSWVKDCGDGKWPSVYTEVAYHRNWIKKHTGI